LKLFNSLGFKLFILQTVIFVCAFALYATVSTREEAEYYRTDMLQTADRISDVIIRSTRSAMLRNQRENVSEIVHTVAGEPGIEGIRIYNKRGETIYANSLADGQATVDMDAEACYGCHGRSDPFESLPLERRARFLSAPEGYRVMGLINPIVNEPDCYNATCHAHPPDQKILGVLDVKMSLEAVDEQVAKRQNAMVLLAIVVVVLLALLSGAFAFFLVHLPVRKLAKGTREVSAGNLDHMIDIGTGSEVGQLADSFNSMTLDLKAARDEARGWSETLEQKVQEKTALLERMQAQMLQAEKMVSMGRLSATVAHELNNPLAGILTYTRLVLRKMRRGPLDEQGMESVTETLETISKETARCGEIVKNMLLFSRQREAKLKGANLHAVLKEALLLVRHHLKISGVEEVTDFRVADDRITCDANQLTQALIALFINAVEAMKEGGTLAVRTEDVVAGRRVKIEIQDTGHGIPEEVRTHIFEPFFTTKQEGAGTGLGLSVAYGVVTRHGGTISVQSLPGQGTTFILELPVVPEAADGADKQA
jgi:two-component system, NtrC family, sensor kinase